MQYSRSIFRLSPWVALAAMLIVAGCGGGGDSSSSAAGSSSSASTVDQQPSGSGNKTPVTAPAPLPTPATASATLSWIAPTTNTNGSALTNLGGFKIYYGAAPNQLTSTIALSNPGVATYVIDGLPVGTTYYFAITAVTTAGIESAESPVVSKTISS
jgi:Fibronectin type III domain